MRYRLEDRYIGTEGDVFLSGVQALARLPLDQLQADRDAGLRTAALVTGYPGSPLAGFDSAADAAARLRPDLAIHCRPALNEEFAATAVMGAQLAATRPDARYDGVVGYWYGKAPGVDRAADALRHAVFAGTSRYGGAVAIVADDPTAKSSTLPSSSVGVLHDLHIPVLYPADPASVLSLGRHAVALSRWSGLWVALKIVADVADGTGSVAVGGPMFAPVLPPDDAVISEPMALLLAPSSVEREREIVEIRYERARRYAAANGLNATVVDPPDAWLGIVVSGITAGELRAALGKLGFASNDAIERAGIRILEMRMPMPFDPDTVARFARGVSEVLVIEEKGAQLEELVIAALYRSAHIRSGPHPVVTGKCDPEGRTLVPAYGGVTADVLAPVLRRRLGERLGDRLAPEPPTHQSIPVVSSARSPYYCSGCPHNRSTEVPAGSAVGVGIGCHTMTLLMEPERVGEVIGLTAMGNEGLQWIGMREFVDSTHLFQNLGDGTYFHSGQLAITAAVASGANITFKLLYNDAVAMTGGQHPQGQRSVADMVAILRHQGVAEVLVTTDQPERYRRRWARWGRTDTPALPAGVKVWHRSRLVEAQEYLASIEGVTVLLHDQPCAANLRRARKRGQAETPTRRISIHHRVCEGCGDCGRVSNCLSVQPVDTSFGRKTRIDHSTCNFDESCVEGDCPSFLSVELNPSWAARLGTRVGGAMRGASRVGGIDEGDLPDTRSSASGPARTFRDVRTALLAIDVPDPAAVGANQIHDWEAGPFSIRITGIGGTGVVTVGQVIGTAAMLDGCQVRGLDQIGLSQKAGPVVSDVQLSRGDSPPSNRVSSDEADLILALDQLVAALPATLATATEARTAVVGSTTQTPTGHTIRHPDDPTPRAGDLIEIMALATDRERHHWADLGEIAERCFGSTVTANTIAIGMAVQAGALPIPTERIEEAITLNGAAVEANLAAFGIGRRIIAAPEQVGQVLGVADLSSVPSVGGWGTQAKHRGDAPAERLPAALIASIADLGEPVAAITLRRAHELIAYQGVELAARYVGWVQRIAEAEKNELGDSHRLSALVASQLFTVMAYKDEYEVARLLLEPEGRAEAERLAGADGVIYYHLHPPMLRALGMDTKIRLGPWADPLLRALAAGKPLRGHRVDPFGWAGIRRRERQFIESVIGDLGLIVEHLRPDNADIAYEMIRITDEVRGYEDLKQERLDAYAARAAALRHDLIRAPASLRR